MPLYEVRCADESCPHHAPGAGFAEDGTGSSAHGMSDHSKATGHKAQGLFEDGHMLAPGNRQTILRLRNLGVIAAPQEAPVADPQPLGGNDGADSAGAGDAEWDDDDEEGEGETEPEPGAVEQPPAQAARAGRPPLPDLTRGYVVARDIPIEPLVALLFEAHLAANEDLYADDAGNVLPYPLALSRFLAECVMFDHAQRPERYPMRQGLEQRHFDAINNHRRALDARQKELDAYRTSLDQRLRDLMEREAVLPPPGGAAHAGA